MSENLSLGNTKEEEGTSEYRKLYWAGKLYYFRCLLLTPLQRFHSRSEWRRFGDVFAPVKIRQRWRWCYLCRHRFMTRRFFSACVSGSALLFFLARHQWRLRCLLQSFEVMNHCMSNLVWVKVFDFDRFVVRRCKKHCGWLRLDRSNAIQRFFPIFSTPK